MRFRTSQGRTVESLEDRRLFCVLHEDGYVTDFPTVTATATADADVSKLLVSVAPTPAGTLSLLGVPSFPTNAAGLPLLTARSSGLKIFLDFDGYNTDTPFDLDGNPSTFNANEQANIYRTWRDIVSYFAPFDVNVTTEQPATGGSNPRFVWHRISNSIQGGAAYVGLVNNTTSNSWTGQDGGTSRHSGVAHEVGHQLGLSHQSEYDAFGVKLDEYSDGFANRDRTIMGVDYQENVRRFYYGRNSDGSDRLVDEMQTAATNIKNWIGSVDGYRPDDFGNTLAGAAAVPASGTVEGIIERVNDADVFQFVSVGGTYHIDATPIFESSAAPKIELLDASGAVLYARDDADRRDAYADADRRDTNNNGQEFDVDLPAGGTFYVRVSGSGDYAEQGEYLLTAARLPGGWTSLDVNNPKRAGTAAYDPATNTLRQMAAGSDIWSTADQFHFTTQVLTGDGSITARIDQLDDVDVNSKAGVMIRQTLDGNSRSVFFGNKPSGQLDPIVRSGDGSSASAPFSPTGMTGNWVRITRVGNAFTFASSSDGVAWTNRGVSNVSMPAKVYVGLATTSRSQRNAAWSTISNIAVTGSLGVVPAATNALPAPTGLAAAPAAGASTSVVLNWTAAAGAGGYEVQRSVDGVTYTAAGTTTAGVLTYTDVNPFGSMRYFYRVVTLTAATLTRSVPSAAVSVVNKPSAPTNPAGGYAVPAILPSSTTAYLNWADVQGDEGYRVERSADGGANFTLLATTPKNATGYNATGLTFSTNYAFRITPVTAVGDGAAPPLVMNVTTRTVATSSFVFTSKQSNSMAMQWSAIGNATGYLVERSTDGANWSDAATLGAGVLTWTDTTVTPVTERYYRVSGLVGGTRGVRSNVIFAAAPPATATLPATWTNADVGAVGGSGTTSLSGGTWTLLGSGADVWNTSDEFQFASRPLIGDGSIVARVATVENTDDNAKSGVMIRESGAANSRYAFAFLTPKNGYWHQYRGSTGGGGSTAASTTGGGPIWVKLTRTGNTFAGFHSADGVNWTALGSETIPMGTTVQIGLALTSHNDAELAKATFDNVTVVGATGVDTTPPPAPVITAVSDDTGSGDSDRLTSDTTLVLRGTAEANSTVTLTRAGVGAVGVTTANAAGAWSVDYSSVVLPAGVHTFTATARDAAGNVSPASAAFTVTVDTTAPTLTAAASLKEHLPLGENAGTGTIFGVPLPLSGTAGVEPRKDGPTTLSLTFDEPLFMTAGFNVTLSSGTLAGPATVSDRTLTVNLTGAANGQVLVVTVAGASDAAGATSVYRVEVGVLWGDVNGNGEVNVTDMNIAKLWGAQPVSAATFRADLNTNLELNVVDMNIAKLQGGNALPPPPPPSPQAAPDAAASSSTLAATPTTTIASPTPAGAAPQSVPDVRTTVRRRAAGATVAPARASTIVLPPRGR